MATKKQQRRKYKRAVAHGRMPAERDPADESESQAGRPNGGAAARKPVMMGAKVIKPPSYIRAAKRALIMSVILWAAIQFISFGGGSQPTPIEAALQAAVFFCWLTPFGYFMDMFIYRRAVKRQG